MRNQNLSEINRIMFSKFNDGKGGLCLRINSEISKTIIYRNVYRVDRLQMVSGNKRNDFGIAISMWLHHFLYRIISVASELRF